MNVRARAGSPAVAPIAVRVAHPTPRPRLARPGLAVAGLSLVAAGLAAAALAPMPEEDFSFYPATVGTVPDVYGPAIGADALQNTIVGGSRNREVAYRFRATESSELESITVYLQTGEGYSSGDLGRLRIQLVADDPAGLGVPSSTLLAATEVDPEFGAGNVYRFESPPRLEAGKVYHVVFRNIDPDPAENYVSLNGLFLFGDHLAEQPGFPRADWAHLTREDAGAWAATQPPDLGTVTPIMGLEYANGRSAGIGYMEVWAHNAQELSGDRRARQVFTVAGPDRTVRAVSIRVKRIAGSGPLEYVLREDRGPVLARGAIPAESFELSERDSRGGASWATVPIPEGPTLGSGTRYAISFWTDDDTSYLVTVIREGRTYRYGPGTYFADGIGEFDDGDGWRPFVGWGEESTEADLQLYFDLAPLS